MQQPPLITLTTVTIPATPFRLSFLQMLRNVNKMSCAPRFHELHVSALRYFGRLCRAPESHMVGTASSFLSWDGNKSCQGSFFNYVKAVTSSVEWSDGFDGVYCLRGSVMRSGGVGSIWLPSQQSVNCSHSCSYHAVHCPIVQLSSSFRTDSSAIKPGRKVQIPFIPNLVISLFAG